MRYRATFLEGLRTSSSKELHRCHMRMAIPTSDETAITAVLERWNAGDREAVARVMPLVYDELRRIAHRLWRGERGESLLQATALVHEAFFQLVETRGVCWHNRNEFYGFAAHLMRRILVLHSRRRDAVKRGGRLERVGLDEGRDVALRGLGGSGSRTPDLLDLDMALHDLAHHDPQKAQIVELRVFGGFTIAETANLLGVSVSTVNRQWRQAIAWLYDALHRGETGR